MLTIPKDKYNFVLSIILIQGIGTLLPWNMFITAEQYFENRLSQNNESAHLGSNFLLYVGLASKIPNISFQALNFFILNKLSTLSTRILISIFIQILMFVFTVVLVIIKIEEHLFFWSTILIVVGLNFANGICQNCLYGTVAPMPNKFTNFYLIGTNISGIFSSILMILSIALAPDAEKSAIYYFSSAILFLTICFFTFLFLNNNSFYKFHQNLKTNQSDEKKIEAKKTFKVFCEIWPQCLNTFLTYFISLALFPNVIGSIEPTSKLISLKYFSPICCFLIFNVFAVIGNYLIEIIPKIKPNYLWLAVLFRLIFVPLFLFCNYLPIQRNTKILIDNDILFIIIAILFSLSHGYLSSLSLTYTPKKTITENQPLAGMISSFFLLSGILAGINISIVFKEMIKLNFI